LTVTNLATTHHLALAATGAGYGLQGIRERMELLGGRCRAGPTTDGWQVEVEVRA
jgi:signal transduction histidine kinase